jgi:hypothetical protein
MTINLKITLAVDPGTLAVLADFGRIYTPADLQALAALKATAERIKAKIDATDVPPQLQQTGK